MTKFHSGDNRLAWPPVSVSTPLGWVPHFIIRPRIWSLYNHCKHAPVQNTVHPVIIHRTHEPIPACYWKQSGGTSSACTRQLLTELNPLYHKPACMSSNKKCVWLSLFQIRLMDFCMRPILKSSSLCCLLRTSVFLKRTRKANSGFPCKLTWAIL